MSELLTQLTGKWWAPKPDKSSLNGKVYVVTGGLNGIGYQTTLALALRGAKIYAGIRDVNRGYAIVEKMEAEYSATIGLVKPIPMEFGTFACTRVAASLTMKELTRLDGLVSCAGQVPDVNGKYTINQDGIEGFMQVNYFSMIVFTEALLPILVKTSRESNSDVRIVTVSTGAGAFSPKTWKFKGVQTFNDPLLPPEKVNDYMNQVARYGISKMLGMSWTKKLQQDFDKAGIDIIATIHHPGGVATDTALKAPLPAWLIKTIAFTPVVGAYTTLFSLTSPEIKKNKDKYKGQYMHPFGKIVQPERKDISDPVVMEELWELTQEIITAGGIKA